ncbi:hypothetical protein GCM10018793_36440 [Streptomyces sulfonofaciens]|uniref:Secreted protein n=1 Tax=Streptomyces sulfonofaciens TaxID=68272 RepID=A0A919GAZ9_9ACTN|nr:hypothetical protein GCM10018793_36440 [Streptomyces sulfonofaciens]
MPSAGAGSLMVAWLLPAVPSAATPAWAPMDSSAAMATNTPAAVAGRPRAGLCEVWLREELLLRAALPRVVPLRDG